VRVLGSVRWAALVGLVFAGFAGTTALGAGVGLPSACALLTRAHPEMAFAHGAPLHISQHKAQKFGTGAAATVVCSETVGKQPVSLSLSGSSGGFGGVKVTSQTHPSGLGAGDTLTVGTSPDGSKPIDFISFHRGSVYAVLTANAGSPVVLTKLARRIFKLL
jgi:hypothetical protein